MSDTVFDSSSYRQAFKNIVRLIQIQALVIVALTGLLYHYVHDVVPQDRYFAETMESGRMQLVSLQDPNVNMEAMLAWAQQAATDILTFGFNDLERRFAYSQKYFSPEGWITFGTRMNEGKLLRTVIDNKQILTAIPKAPPQMRSWGWRNGKFCWDVSVPIIMTTRAGKNKTTQNVRVEMTIIRLPTAENPRGIAIDSWVSR